MYLQCRVHDRRFINTHLARAHRVPEADGGKPCEVLEFCFAKGSSRNQFRIAYLIKARLSAQLARHLNAFDCGVHIIVGAQEIGMEKGMVLPIGTYQL